jgi:DNA repair exonuclease SbcCD ATPase subunit
MIIFEKLRWKNFLSTGNNFTEINFVDSPTTLIIGHNGSGKSTMLDALSFALFGKSHRKISKPQLVNSINNKGLLVEVEFRIGRSNYKIVRGIKPNKFEIWVNGNMLNQDSHNKEYQSVLEKNIIKLNHKSFHQIVVLGSSSFVPFMQLPAQARREVIEDLLDINMFSKMNQLLKEKMAILKEDIRQNAHSTEIVKTKINAQKKYLRDLTAINSAYRKEKEDSISAAQEEINTIQAQNFNLSLQISDILPSTETGLTKTRTQLSQLVDFDTSFKTKAKTIAKEIKFFSENDDCPTCGQEIDAETRDKRTTEGKVKAKELAEAMSKAREQMDVLQQKEQEFVQQMETIREWQNEININNNSIARLQRSIDQLQQDIQNLSNDNGDLEEANKQMAELDASVAELQDAKYKLHEDYSYQQVCSELLKDTGIKTKIIKQYLPVINNLTNQYLQILDFFVHFDLDESFTETIRSRHRDSFSYDSFSEGEKQRIDLALLFTWRQVAKMKNSVATNLLILDETFDSSLDADGVDNLMKILHSLGEDSNIFVISHKSELEDAHFQKKIEFVKEKNFSKMKAA